MNRTPVPSSPALPLLRAQQGIWYGIKLDPTGALYNLAQSIEIIGHVDRTIFAQAAQEVIAETEALRLVFEETEHGPVQHVLPLSDWSLDYFDFSTQANPREAAFEWMRQQHTLPFDVTKPLFRWALIKTADDCFQWV